MMDHVSRRWSAIGVLLLAGVATVTPARAQTSFTPLGSIQAPADWVRVQGKYAYVAAGPDFTIFDVGNPSAPKREGTYSFPHRIWGFSIVGSLVYVAADFFGLGILDVSNPAAPTLRGSLKTPGQAKNVALVGTTALITDHVSGVDIVDVSNPAAPASKGSFFLEGYARDVASSGSMAYAVDAPTGLYVFDLSKPGPVEPVSSIQSPNPDRSSPLHPDVEVAGGDPQGRRIVCVVRSESLQIYDVSDPLKPVSVATFRTPGGRPQRATLQGRLAYVADGEAGLVVVDLATPSAPRVLSTYATPSPARAVAVADSLVFVVVGDLRRDSRSPSGTGVVILRQGK